MERPSLDRYRQVLQEEGINLTDKELREVREQIHGLARMVVELYQAGEAARGGGSATAGRSGQAATGQRGDA